MILFFNFFAFGSNVADFAPMDIGSTWKYSYYYSETYICCLEMLDSLSIDIVLLNKEVKGKDTLLLLKIKEQGRSVSPIYSPVFDTIGNLEFIDTVIVSNDSIYKSASFKCKIFPFFNSHTVDSSKLVRFTNAGDDTLFYYSSNGYGYLQGVGFFKINTSGGNHRWTIKRISLVSYNDKSFSLETVKCRQTLISNNPYILKSKKELFLTKHKNNFDRSFLLTGKLSTENSNISPGFLIRNSNEIKNK